MIVLTAILLGLIGTSLMTIYMNLVSYLIHLPIQVERVLGNMVTFQANQQKGMSGQMTSIRTGFVSHYLVGILFALLYLFLCRHNVVQPTLLQTVLFGFFCGAFGITFWKMLFDMHPNPPSIPVNTYLINIWCAHVIFGLGLWLSYKLVSMAVPGVIQGII